MSYCVICRKYIEPFFYMDETYGYIVIQEDICQSCNDFVDLLTSINAEEDDYIIIYDVETDIYDIEQ